MLARVAIGLMLLGAALLAPRTARDGFSPTDTPEDRGHWLALGAVLFLGAFLRFWRLGAYPRQLDYDSVQNGWIGLTLVERLPRYEPVLIDWATGNETAFIYLLGFSLELFGHSIEALRMPAALFGTLTLVAIYLLGRELFSRQLGLAAAFLLALSPAHIHLSRMAKQPILVPLVTALALLCLARALRSRNSRQAWIYCAACGLLVGAGLHTYEAARILPLVIALALVWVRWRQGCFRRGLAELGVTALAATLVALPLLIFAARHPELYMSHVSINSIFHLVSEERSIAPLLENMGRTLYHSVFGLPGLVGRIAGTPAIILGLVPALFLFGLRGLSCKPREARLDPHGRQLLLVTLLLMTLPFMLARFHVYSPRRYTGVMIPFYLLGAGTLVGLWRALASGLPRRALGGGVTLAAVGALMVVPAIFSHLERWSPGVLDPAEQQILRWALAESAGRDVYLAPELVGSGYLAKFFLAHPSLRQLPTVWPLPDGPLTRDLVLISNGEPWWPVLGELFGARKRTIELDLPPGVHAPRLVAYHLPHEAVRARRLAPERLAEDFDALLLISRPGAYRFRPPANIEARIRVAGTVKEIDRGGDAMRVSLAAGLHRISYRPEKPGHPLRWIPPGARSWAPLPAGNCWLLKPGQLPDAPPTRALKSSFLRPVSTRVPARPAYEPNRALQDLAPGRGGYYMLDLDRFPLKHWILDKPITQAPILFAADGQPVVYEQRYEIDLPKEMSLAVADRIYLLDRRRSTIHRFDLDGRMLGPLRGRFTQPFDIAATDEAVYVADLAGETLYRCDPSGRRPPEALVRGIRPVAVAVRGNRLAYLDRQRHQLVVCDKDGKQLRTIQLGRVALRMRLSLAEDGRMVICDPPRQEVLLFGADGALLALDGDPLAISARLLQMDDQPVAAHLDSRGKQLVILGIHWMLLRLTETITPDHLPGLTLRGIDGKGNLNRAATEDFGLGLVIDGGLHPARCAWRFKIQRPAAYEVWAYYAVNDERPLTLTVDQTVRGRNLKQLTGGYTTDNLRWQKLAVVTLSEGDHSLELSTEGLFPHLARVRLVRKQD